MPELVKEKPPELSPEDLELPPPPEPGVVVPPALLEVPDIAPPPRVELKKKAKLPEKPKESRDTKIKPKKAKAKPPTKKPTIAKKVKERPEREKAVKGELDEEREQHHEELKGKIEELAIDMRRMLTGGQLDAAGDALLRIQRHCQQIGKQTRLGPLEYELRLLETDLKLARLG